MKKHITLIAAVIGIASGASFAQTTPDTPTRAETDVQRNANQQERIEQGLQSGQLNTKEAGKLEKEQAHIDTMEKRDLRNGKISAKEQAKLNAAQNKASADITAQKHDAQTGNPDSASSKRMQADVQRNADQQTRIEQGMKSGELTNREAGSLEKGQAKVDRTEARAARNGHVTAREQAKVEATENRQSKRVHHKKHNDTEKQ